MRLVAALQLCLSLGSVGIASAGLITAAWKLVTFSPGDGKQGVCTATWKGCYNDCISGVIKNPMPAGTRTLPIGVGGGGGSGGCCNAAQDPPACGAACPGACTNLGGLSECPKANKFWKGAAASCSAPAPAAAAAAGVLVLPLLVLRGF